MLSGMIAGGMTAKNKQLWINQDLANTLSLPNTKQTNMDVNAVVRVVRLDKANTDYQAGIVGKDLTTPFQVIALDANDSPVQGVNITFKVLAGGGQVKGIKPLTAKDTQVTVITGADGIAWALLTLGQKTSVSPYYRQMTDSKGVIYWELVGQNFVSVYATT